MDLWVLLVKSCDESVVYTVKICYRALSHQLLLTLTYIGFWMVSKLSKLCPSLWLGGWTPIRLFRMGWFGVRSSWGLKYYKMRRTVPEICFWSVIAQGQRSSHIDFTWGHLEWIEWQSFAWLYDIWTSNLQGRGKHRLCMLALLRC